MAGRQSLWKVCPGDAEQLSGFEVGDWVRSKPNTGNRPTYDWNIAGRDGFGVVHSVQDCLFLELACCTRRNRWLAHASDVEKVSCYKVGQYVRFRPGLSEPMWGWRGAKSDSRGIITSVHSDGEVRVAFFGVPGLWRGDPADFAMEDIFEAGDWVRLRENTSKWKSIGPGSIGVVQGLRFEGDEWDGRISVLFCGEQASWVDSITYLERVDRLVVGQKVRVKSSISQPRFGWSMHNSASVGLISAIDADGKLKIYTAAGSKTWILDPAEVELVQDEEFNVRDWVRVKASVSTPNYQWGEVNHSSIGVVHRKENGELFVSFCFMEKKLWLCKEWEMERVRPFKIGDKVMIREGLVAPRWGWGMETRASRGQVVGVDANGKLRIKFRWREGKPWIGDPADIALDEN